MKFGISTKKDYLTLLKILARIEKYYLTLIYEDYSTMQKSVTPIDNFFEPAKVSDLILKDF